MLWSNRWQSLRPVFPCLSSCWVLSLARSLPHSSWLTPPSYTPHLLQEGPPPHFPGLDWVLHIWLTQHTAAAPVILRWHPVSFHAAKLCALSERGLSSLFLCPCCSARSPEYSKFSIPICVEWLKKQNRINKWVMRMFSVIFQKPFCSWSEIHLHFVYTWGRGKSRLFPHVVMQVTQDFYSKDHLGGLPWWSSG